jgi:uncharacterized protein YdhG (YjbR/CyaY superfamily)
MKFNDVDSYIAKSPKQTQAKLSRLRETIKAAAPKAEEVISYNMPYYKYQGPLLGFAIFKEILVYSAWYIRKTNVCSKTMKPLKAAYIFP